MIDIYKSELEKNAKRVELMIFLNRHPELHNYHIEKNELEDLLFSFNYVLGYNSSIGINNFFDYKIPGFKNQQELEKVVNLDDMESIKKHGVLAKFPVWSGPFLRQLDLSEVDFSHVVWNTNFLPCLFWAFDCNAIQYFLSKPLGEKKEGIEYAPYVDYSHTNISVDFSKSFDSSIFSENHLFHINLNGVDLSQSHTNTLTKTTFCNLVGTNFVVNANNFYAYYCDLQGISLTHVKSYYFNDIFSILFNPYTHCFEHCNVQNSGLQIDIDLNDKEQLKEFMEDVEKGFYNGCTIHSLTPFYYNPGDDFSFHLK